jgi:hypothetical protein
MLICYESYHKFTNLNIQQKNKKKKKKDLKIKLGLNCVKKSSTGKRIKNENGEDEGAYVA